MTAGRRSAFHFKGKVSFRCANASTQTFSSNIEKPQNKTKIKKKFQTPQHKQRLKQTQQPRCHDSDSVKTMSHKQCNWKLPTLDESARSELGFTVGV